jgi:streptomycin 6-kinase
MDILIPNKIAKVCEGNAEKLAWLDQLPDALHDLQQRWSIELGAPIDGDEVTCSWVAPVTREDGSTAMIKLGMPHMEATHEIHGLRFWNGDPTVWLLEEDINLNAMLLERCDPGTVLRARPEPEQDVVIAGLLRRLWRTPPETHPFRPLTIMLDTWCESIRKRSAELPDPGLVEEALQLFQELPRTAPRQVLLATDLHAGNVLEAQREPWLVIDPKPFVGDPAYDAVQHLFNCDVRLRADPLGLVRRFADLLEVDSERVQLWVFARAATEDWVDQEVARALAP